MGVSIPVKGRVGRYNTFTHLNWSVVLTGNDELAIKCLSIFENCNRPYTRDLSPVSRGEVLGNSVESDMPWVCFLEACKYIDTSVIHLFQKKEGEDNGQDSDEGSTAGG